MYLHHALNFSIIQYRQAEVSFILFYVSEKARRIKKWRYLEAQ